MPNSESQTEVTVKRGRNRQTDKKPLKWAPSDAEDVLIRKDGRYGLIPRTSGTHRAPVSYHRMKVEKGDYVANGVVVLVF